MTPPFPFPSALNPIGLGGGGQICPHKKIILHSRPHFLSTLLNFFWNHGHSARLRHYYTFQGCGDSQTSRSSIRFWSRILGAESNRVKDDTAIKMTMMAMSGKRGGMIIWFVPRGRSCFYHSLATTRVIWSSAAPPTHKNWSTQSAGRKV